MTQRMLQTCFLLAIFLFWVGFNEAGVKTLASKGAKTPGAPDSYRAGEVVVGMVAGGDVQALVARHDMTIKDRIPGTDQWLLATPRTVEETLTRLATETSVLFAGPNNNFRHAEIRQRSQAFIDQRSQAFIDGQSPVDFYGQPSLPRLHLAEAHQISMGSGVRVAVIDTGIDFAHPAFAGRILSPYYDFLDNDPDPQEMLGGAGSGHGTFVAGLVALAAPGAMIMPLRAFGPDGSGNTFDIARAIRYAADNGAQIINMSFGLLGRDAMIEDALSYAYERVYMVAAAGNDNQYAIHFPGARSSKTLSVTSTDHLDLRAPFSNYHRDIHVSAPGVDLFSAYPGKRWARWSGTSFSTALVTGEAALVLRLNPSLGRKDLNEILTNAGVNIDGLNPGFARTLGEVRIDFLSAVRRARE